MGFYDMFYTVQQSGSAETEKKWKSYKETKTMEQRLKESELIVSKFNDKIPVIIDECPIEFRSRFHRKMLVKQEMTMTEFLYQIRKKFNVHCEECVIVFINNKLITGSKTFYEIYKQEKDLDGFLYVVICKENAFGNNGFGNNGFGNNIF